MTVLMENVRHVKEEEDGWFPRVRAGLSRTRLTEIGARMAELKASSCGGVAGGGALRSPPQALDPAERDRHSESRDAVVGPRGPDSARPRTSALGAG